MTQHSPTEREASDHEPAEKLELDGRFDGEPTTDYHSKRVMLRAERGDSVVIATILARFRDRRSIPERLAVLRRMATYYGPELLLESDSRRFLLTAPGPTSELLLWSEIVSADGTRRGWEQVAEVQATFAESDSRYAICTDCGEPIKTAEHDRMALIGRCPGVSD